MILSIIDEREARQTEAESEVMGKWANPQTVTGPFLTIPYKAYNLDSNGSRTTSYRANLHLLPEELKVQGNLSTETLHRGIYSIPVYTAALKMSGSFDLTTVAELKDIDQESLLMNEISLVVGIDDLRGINDPVHLRWGDSSWLFKPGVPSDAVVTSGMTVPLPISLEMKKESLQFQTEISLKGSDRISFVPVGKQTIVELKSQWASPSFRGAFLPDERTVTSGGFSALWKKLNLNRNYPQVWSGGTQNLAASEFGVQLKVPVETYQKSTRAVKYAIMIIGLSFLLFFFIELLSQKALHPLQYLLIGLAFVIYYTLLLSISEHLGFNIAYLIATVLTIGLVVTYTLAVLEDRLFSGIIGGTLAVVYGFMFTILQLEDFSLLVGSLGLFTALSVVMYFSRKIDWSNTVRRKTV